MRSSSSSPLLLSQESWLLHPPALNLAGGDCCCLRHYPECYYLLCRYHQFCFGGTKSGAADVGAWVASWRCHPPLSRRHCLLCVCPQCIYLMMRWLSSALWAVVPLCLLHHRPYRRCLQSRSRACRLSHRQWLLSGWWVGGAFLRHPHPNPVRRSLARILLTRRETLMSSVCRQRASAEKYPRR